MIEDFLQRKLAALLDQYIQFEKLKFSTTEGMSIRNSKVRPKLAQQMSQIAHMPLELIGGSIESLTLNRPWEKLFFFINSPIQISVQNVHIKTRLKNSVDEEYLIKQRQNLISRLTEGLYNPLDASIAHRSSYINRKLKEHFLGHIILEVKNLCVQIEINLTQKIQLLFRIDRLTFRKEQRKIGEGQKIHLEITGLGISYRVAGKQYQLMAPTRVQLFRVKTEAGQQKKRTSVKKFLIEKLQFNVNNINYGDIARMLLLIQWHNSFNHLPYNLWRLKPFILNQIKPSQKLIYYGHLVIANIKESKYADQLKIRRQYINFFLEYLAESSNFDSQKKKAMNKIELSLPLWKIVAYRNFCIQYHKNTILKKRQQASQTIVDWFKSWSLSQINRVQLQEQFLKKIETLDFIHEDIESIVYVSIERLKIKISIQVHSNFQPFLCLVGTDCSLRINELILEKSWSIQAEIIRCKVQYEKYLGHCERYRNLISQCKQHLSISKIVSNDQASLENDEDEFADIGKFLQVSFTNECKIIQFKLLPFDIFINHQILEKFAIVMNVDKLSKIWKADQLQDDCIDRTNPWLIIQQQRIKIMHKNSTNLHLLEAMKLSGSYSKPENNLMTQSENDVLGSSNSQSQQRQQQQQQQRDIRVVTSFNIIVPQNLMINNSPELVIQVGQMKFSMKGMLKRLDMKAIMVKFKIPEVGSAEQQGLQQVVNFLSQKMEQIIFIRKFNATLDLEKHQNFDKNILVVDPLNIQIPQKRFLFSMIQLLLLLVPKQKQNRVKQYYRRKASIGEQFIDACQNLKQHIAKSIILTSERQSKKSILKQKRTKQGTIIIKGINMTDKMFQFLMGEARLQYNQVGIDNRSLTSYNPKEVKLTIHNLRQLLEKGREINLHYKKEYLKRGFSNDRQKLQEYPIQQLVELQQFNVQVIVTLKKFKKINSPSIVLQLSNLNIFKNTEDNAKGFQTNLSLSYDEQIIDSERLVKVPLVETCFIHFLEQDKYNLRDRILKMGTLNINLKPSLLKFAQRAIKDYHLQQQMKCTIINQTINTLKIKKSQQNYFNQLKNNQKLIFNNFYCQILIFGIKHQLTFHQPSDQIPVEKIQTLQIGSNNFLINKQISPNNYAIQSNVRVINHQDKTLWLKITQNSSSIITPDYEDTRRRLKKLSYTPKRRQQPDLMSRFELDQEEAYGKGIIPQINAKKRKGSGEQFEQKIKFNAGKVFSIPLKPKDKIHLLIDENDFNYIQIYDQGVVFTEIALSELFETTELVLKGQGSDEDQYLVIRSQITSKKELEGSIFTFHIYSPVYIVNKTPWDLEYRLSEQQLLINEEQENKKIGRRKSFQLIPLKSIPILSSEKIRNVHYNQIQTMKLQLNKYEREIGSLTSLIRSVKQRRGVSQDSFFQQKERMLITLRKNKKQIQLILQLEFSMNILKIKIYPEIVFVNMTKQTILFEIKEDQITYPQICLKRVENIEDKQQKNKRQQKIKKSQSLNHLSEYINITDEKIKSRDNLKQLFEGFCNNLEVFTGKIPKNGYSQNVAKPKRKIIFKNYSINPQLSASKLLGLSSRGYVSDYGSQGQFRQDIISLQQQPLEQQNIFVYSQSQYMFYKRSLLVDNYFNIMIVIPTVHIINKTQAIFYAKNASELPVKVSKENHNFILTNQQSIYLQASFEQEEISLNEWIKVDLNRLGTIYCSKDMRTHHASGYESKQYNLRKKKMKKIPRMFYRILLCKFQRGQKILIEQSQYPPYSFINNTERSIKIEDTHQHFIQQFSTKGDMAEYAPLNPYQEPQFRIYVAQNYQYRLLSSFGVQQKRVIKLEKDLFISIEQYKQKIIVNIKDKEDSLQMAQQTHSILERSEGDALLQQTSKFTFDINKINIAVLNQWNRQLNSNYIQNFTMTHENKNYKDYYKMQIGTVEGYDYTSIKPDYIYKRRTEQKGLGFINKQKQLEGNFFNIQIINNYHKNAQIIEKFQIKLSELVFYLSADLILAYVKHFYEPLLGLLSVYKYYQGHRKEEKPSSFMSKTFIFESLKWFGTSLKIQTRNLSIMQAFLNKNSQKWLVKFINWLGGIKPIGIQPLQLTYQQITLMKLKKRVNIQKKINEIKQQMMDYPVSQLNQIVFFILGVEEKSLIDRISLFKNVAKSLQYILNFTLSINENLKPQRKSYQQAFTEQHKSNMDIIKKMISFQFCEWKYKQSHSPSLLATKIKRLQRYNKRQQIFEYDDLKAKIKLAVDHQAKNKLWKKIENVFKINSQTIIAVVNQNFVLFNSKKMEWNTILVQWIVGFFYKDRILEIYFRDENAVKQSEQNIQHKFGIRHLTFKNTQLHEDSIRQIKTLIDEQKLSYYY